jgi:hypothetical protein
MHSQMLTEMVEHIEKKNFNIDSLLIVRNDYMVFDAYFYPFSNEQKHHIYSCTKSIMSALIGIAIDKGYIQNVNQPITDFFTDKAFANMDDLKKSITLENLLMMASGLRCGGWIVPSAWVEISARGHIDATPYDNYGYQWWVDSAGYYMAAGYRGQRIFVVPDKNIVAVFTGSDERGQVSKNLLDSYIIPAVSSSEALPSNTEEQARLDALVNRIATAKAYTWTSENEGIAKDGVFKRAASPVFKFEYPLGSRKEAIRYRGEVMRMRTPGNILFSAYVVDIPDGMKIEDFGPKFYAQNLENYGSNIKVFSNKEIVLKCGTKANRTDITWLRNNTIWMTALIVSAYKDDKCIYLLAETWKYHDKLEPIVQSLSFK